MRVLLVSTVIFLCIPSTTAIAPREQLFDDPMFRRCVVWMLSSLRGANVIDNKYPRGAMILAPIQGCRAMIAAEPQRVC